MNKQDTWDAIKDDEITIRTFINLRDRWADEHDYEDWKDYEKVMRKLFPNLISATKRPFGVHLKCDDGPIYVFLKIKGNSAGLCAEKR